MQDEKINKKISSRLKCLLNRDEQLFIQGGDLSDLGNLIGIAVGSYIENNSNGYELEDLYSGIEHGIDLIVNHGEYINFK